MTETERIVEEELQKLEDDEDAIENWHEGFVDGVTAAIDIIELHKTEETKEFAAFIMNELSELLK